MEKFRKHKFDCTLSPLRWGLNEEAWVGNRIGASFAEILFTIIKIAKNKNIQRSKIIL